MPGNRTSSQPGTDLADPPRLRGRKAEAARNDAAIIAAARTVFLRDPSAPMAAVAEEAGVGVGGLYRRYASKDDLLQTLCGQGLRHFVALADTALARASAGADPWGELEGFLRGVVESDVHALTVHLAGTFRTTDELSDLASRSGVLVEELVDRARAAGSLRADVTAADLPMIFEQLSAIRVSSPERTGQLRRRYLALHLDALRAGPHVHALDAEGPTPSELRERWDQIT